MGDMDKEAGAFPRETKGGIVRKFLYIAALSIAATLAFQSVAAAQETTGLAGECAGAAERLAADQANLSADMIEMYYSYLPDVGGCVSFEGNTYIGSLSAPVFDPDTGEELGIVKDLDPDLTSGDFSVTYEEFCGGFIPAYEAVAQEYYDQQANSQEQAILDPDTDGLACTDEDAAFLSGDVGEPSGDDEPCAGLEDILGLPSPLISMPDAGGCIFLTGQLVELTLDQLYAPVFDPGTGEELGLLKNLDPDLASGDFSVSYEELCGAFPTPEAEGFSYAGTTAQEYFEQLANEQERAILDPDTDGLACTLDDEAFLSGDVDYEPEFDLEDTWTGIVTQTNPDGEVIEFDIEAEMMPVSDITEAMIGEVIGEVGYPGVGCSGVWILEGFDGDTLMVGERITEGKENCLEIPITLTPLDDGSLEYFFQDPSGIVGECVLFLQRSDISDDPEDIATDGRKPSDIMGELGMTELPNTGGIALLFPLGGAFLASSVFAAALSRRRTTTDPSELDYPDGEARPRYTAGNAGPPPEDTADK